jgi:choline-glycine betaine transporter
VFVSAAADISASVGRPQLKAALPKVFKIASWIFLTFSGLGIAALFFAVSEWRQISIDMVCSGVLAWRFRQASIQRSVASR